MFKALMVPKRSHLSAMWKGMTEFPMSAQCSRRANSSCLSSPLAKMLSWAGSGMGIPKVAKDWADVPLFMREPTTRPLEAVAIFLALSSLNTSSYSKQAESGG